MRKFLIPSALAAALLCTAYAASPLVTLYRLADALRRGDAQALAPLVDWDAVREGIEEDICDNPPEDAPAQARAQLASDQLPAFGASFVQGVAAHTVNAVVTPAGLAAASASRASDVASTTPASMRLRWASFARPTVFMVDLDARGAGMKDAPVRLRLDLRDGYWLVTRAWLPPSMLAP